MKDLFTLIFDSLRKSGANLHGLTFAVTSKSANSTELRSASRCVSFDGELYKITIEKITEENK